MWKGHAWSRDAGFGFRISWIQAVFKVEMNLNNLKKGWIQDSGKGFPLHLKSWIHDVFNLDTFRIHFENFLNTLHLLPRREFRV